MRRGEREREGRETERKKRGWDREESGLGSESGKAEGSKQNWLLAGQMPKPQLCLLA